MPDLIVATTGLRLDNSTQPREELRLAAAWRRLLVVVRSRVASGCMSHPSESDSRDL